MEKHAKPKTGIKRKIISVICLTGGILIAVGMALGYYGERNLLRDIIAYEHVEIARRIAFTVSEQVTERVKSLRVISLRHLWVVAAEESNQKYKDMDSRDIQNYFSDMDKLWANAKGGSALAEEYLNNISGTMARNIINGDEDIVELFITDKFGGLVASSGKTSDFYQADEEWWQRAYNNGKGAIYIGEIGFDESSNIWSIPIAIPLKDADGTVIGVCKNLINTRSFFSSLDRVDIGKTGHAVLVSNDAIILHQKNIEPLSERVYAEKEFQKLIKDKKSWTIRKDFNEHKQNTLSCFARVENEFLAVDNVTWWVFIEQAAAEVFAPLNVLVKGGVLLTALLIAILMILGLVLGAIFVKPIKKLHKAIEHIGKGELDYSIEVKTGDEVESLADAFKEMISRIKEKEAEVLQQKIYAEGIISSMIDTLIVVNPDGILRSVNKTTCDLLGYTEEEIIEKDVSLIFTEEEEERLFKGKRLIKLIEEGSVHDFEMSYKTKSGEKIPVSFSGSVMRDKDDKLVGVVGVARDMRHTRALIADLEASKAQVEQWAGSLEKKVEERTRDLTESQQATLYIMEDIQKSKEELEKTNIELEKAQVELQSFSQGLEEKVKERTTELSILYEVSNAISYTLDYQTLLKLIMESLFKIVDYDICASLLFDTHTAHVTLRPAYPGSAKFVEEVKNSLLDSTTVLTGEALRKKRLSVFLIPFDSNAKLKETKQFDDLRSFFNVPFVVRGKTIGMINVSSCRDNAFSENDLKLIYTIANQASNAIERLQAVITAEKSKMESMVEGMIEGVIMFDERGEIVVLNPQVRQMFGFNLTEDVISRRLIEKMNTVGLYDTFQECQNERKLITKEITVPHGEDSMVLRCDIAPVKDTEGGVIGMVIILIDITKEKEIDRMKTEFISTVSHELRTPLTTMKGFVSIISDEIPGKLNKSQKEYIDIINGNIDRLARLINNLLDISKIEAGKAELKKTLVDVINLAKATVSASMPEAAAKHIDLKTLFPTSKIDIYADSDKIIQIFTNLIGNAIKFTPEKGQITVEIIERGKEVECSVADTGTGITADDAKRLFTKFQQFGRTTGAGAKGTGLGLAISKELVYAHNGKIWAESTIGKGSKFIFTLPRQTAESLFKEYLNNGIKRAMRNDSKMSLIVISLVDFDGLREKLTGEAIESILKDMEDILRNSLRREEGDIAIKGIDEVAVVLADCDKDNALRVEGRFENILEGYLARKKLVEKIKLRFGRATYPDEAKNDQQLIEKAKKS